jgi:hypothetical protein
MVFGYLVVRTQLPLVRLVSRLPQPVGRGWAALLNSVTGLFPVINAVTDAGDEELIEGSTLRSSSPGFRATAAGRSGRPT